jgi:glycosyltransferase involved in cell wall biosynthesis
MPTSNRPKYVKQAIACFQAQTYPEKELIILDSGTPIKANWPRNVFYHRIDGTGLTLGELRNAACRLSHGELIAHWDDDDYSHPKRLAEQVRFLRSTDADVVGYRSMHFVCEETKKAWLYRNEDVYALGTSLLYTRDYWRSNKFPKKDAGEDYEFIEPATQKRSIHVTDGTARMIARNHSENTCERELKWMFAPLWQPADYEQVSQLLRSAA